MSRAISGRADGRTGGQADVVGAELRVRAGPRSPVPPFSRSPEFRSSHRSSCTTSSRECGRVAAAESALLTQVHMVFDLDSTLVDPDHVERRWSAASGADRVGSSSTHRKPTRDLARPFGVIVPAENGIGLEREQRSLSGMRTGKTPATRDDTREDVVVQDGNPHLVGGGRGEPLAHSADLRGREMADHRQVVGIVGQRPKGDAVRRAHPGHDQVIQLKRRTPVISEISVVLRVFHPVPKDAKRASPSLHIVVAGNDIDRSELRETPEEPLSSLKLSVPRPLGQVAGNHDDAWRQRGKCVRQRDQLGRVCPPPEMNIRDMSDDDFAHQMTRTR